MGYKLNIIAIIAKKLYKTSTWFLYILFLLSPKRPFTQHPKDDIGPKGKYFTVPLVEVDFSKKYISRINLEINQKAIIFYEIIVSIIELWWLRSNIGRYFGNNSFARPFHSQKVEIQNE